MKLVEFVESKKEHANVALIAETTQDAQLLYDFHAAQNATNDSKEEWKIIDIYGEEEFFESQDDAFITAHDWCEQTMEEGYRVDIFCDGELMNDYRCIFTIE